MRKCNVSRNSLRICSRRPTNPSLLRANCAARKDPRRAPPRQARAEEDEDARRNNRSDSTPMRPDPSTIGRSRRRPEKKLVRSGSQATRPAPTRSDPKIKLVT
jgi:hypothetical protein